MIKQLYLNYKDTGLDYFWRALQVFGKEGITFFIFVIAAKLLNPFDFGNYNYIMALVFFLIMFGDFGISTATSKFVAEFDETDKEKLKSVLFNSSLIILILAILISAFVLLFGHLYIKQDYLYAIYLLPLVFLAPMTSLYDGIYRGLKKFRLLTIISLCVGLPFLPLIFFLIRKFGLMGALISQDLFYLILLISLGIFYKEWHFKLSKSVITQISKYSLIIGITTLGYFLFTRINTIILGQFGYITQIGYYEIINKMFAILLIPFSILSQVIAPRVTRLFAKGEKKELVEQYKKYMLFIGLLSLALALVSYLIFPFIVKIFLVKYYSPTFIKMFDLLLIILLTQSCSNVASVGFSTASGHAKLNMYFLMVFGALNVILTIGFVKLFGFWGVIYSTVIIKAASDLSFVYIYYLYVKNNK
jgi:polysaccharide transporter, PST family